MPSPRSAFSFILKGAINTKYTLQIREKISFIIAVVKWNNLLDDFFFMLTNKSTVYSYSTTFIPTVLVRSYQMHLIQAHSHFLICDCVNLLLCPSPKWLLHKLWYPVAWYRVKLLTPVDLPFLNLDVNWLCGVFTEKRSLTLYVSCFFTSSAKDMTWTAFIQIW